MARALKVFRTPAGFHDAYVAAPSQKAALEAWGSDANLFARGVAEVVTDPQLTAEPLANPGKVIKRLRGSTDDHFDALPKTKKRPAAQPRSAPAPAKAHARTRKAPPRPSRARLDAAEEKVASVQTTHGAELTALKKREAALRRERERLEGKQAAELEKAERQMEKVKRAYDAAIAKWSSDCD